MIRTLSLALLVTALGCAAPSPAPLSSLDEEYSAYSALLVQKYLAVEQPPGYSDTLIHVVIQDSTGMRSAGDLSDALEQIRERLPSLQAETIHDFALKNQRAHAVERRFDLPVAYAILTDAQLDSLFKSADGEGWNRFYRLYPKADGLFTLSRVGFNTQKDQALIHVGNQSHWLSGAGFYILLRKVGGKWEIAHEVPTWVS